MNFQTWFNTFLEEKALPSEEWLIVDKNGLDHHITSAVVIEAIFSASKYEQSQIKNTNLCLEIFLLFLDIQMMSYLRP